MGLISILGGSGAVFEGGYRILQIGQSGGQKGEMGTKPAIFAQVTIVKHQSNLKECRRSAMKSVSWDERHLSELKELFELARRIEQRILGLKQSPSERQKEP